MDYVTSKLVHPTMHLLGSWNAFLKILMKRAKFFLKIPTKLKIT